MTALSVEGHRMPIRPFTPNIQQVALDDLRARLLSVRWPASLDCDSWDDGASMSFMRRLVDYWLYRFDWRAQESKINRLPHAMASIGDGSDIHFIHQRGRGPSPLPLILTHGWPGSFIEMEAILPLLTDPAAHGGDATDAFHVVVPSLPGFGLSPAPRMTGVSSEQIAQLWHGLMLELGYSRFAAQGGDIGAGVSMWLARQFPDSVVGIHLNYISGNYRPSITDQLPVTSQEQDFLDRSAAWAAAEGAYAAVHSTKPQTLAYSLASSPVGLAAWIVEKLRSWSDCHGNVESVFSLDTMLTDISLYWFGNNLDASLRLYKENRLNPLAFQATERVVVRLGVAHFPRELPMPPRSWLERVFDVHRWTSMPRGGHFAALEQPQLLVDEIRAFFRPLRRAI
jgi:pimeloyl-ACP methyl ester carboxylesterase